MTFDIAITVSTEHTSFYKLLDVLVHYPHNIHILIDADYNHHTQEINERYGTVNNIFDHVRKLENNFADHRNYLLSKCTADYVFSIDADEYPTDVLLDNLETIVEANPDVELFHIPRVNIIRGLTQAKKDLWGWRLSKLLEFNETKKRKDISDEEYDFLKNNTYIITEVDDIVVYALPIINWEHDYQGRLYKRLPNIKWTRALHEHIEGHLTSVKLPLDPDLALIHDKTIQRQIEQNEFYLKNWSLNENARYL